MAVKVIPDGYHSVTPYLIVKGADRAIDFYKKVFGASQRMRMDGPNGTVGHAEIEIDGSAIMLADEFPDMGFRSPQSLGGAGVSLHLYVKDVDACFNRAVAAGAKALRPVQDQFYGDRSGTLEDPFGHVWTISTHKEDLSPDEIRKRSEAFMKQQGGH
ncbi:MAG TPA: VOC family protein [Candidatus Udaeobacter sp.]|jgi:PhnB protein|nr:VOC family protein [Candidatus Udaeobacter sp.]